MTRKLDGEQELRLYESIQTLDALLPAPAVMPLVEDSLYRVLRRAAHGMPLLTAEYTALVRAVPADYRPELFVTIRRVGDPGGYQVLLRYRRATTTNRPSS